MRSRLAATPATVVSFALIYAVFVTGLNVFMGFANQVSFGQNAFAAIGGYTSAILTANHDWPVLPAILAGMLLALAAATLIGLPTLRLKGHYLAMGTLAIGLIVYEITVEWQTLTQGYLGISGIPPLGIGGWEITSDRGNLVALSLIVLLARLRRRPVAAFAGRPGPSPRWPAARRRRGRSASARAGPKLLAFLVSAALAALSGSLFVHVVGYVSPESSACICDPDLHHALCRRHRDHCRAADRGADRGACCRRSSARSATYQDLVYGAALILLLIYAPRGLSRAVPAAGGMIPLLTLQNVTRRFGGLVAVNDVSLIVPAQGVTAVIGPKRRRQDDPGSA